MIKGRLDIWIRWLQDLHLNLKEILMADAQHTTNWPDLAIGLYDRLTGRNAEITYDFDDMHVKIPSGTGPNVEHAEWILTGTLKIRTRDAGAAPN
jgi:hypothetical protein